MRTEDQAGIAVAVTGHLILLAVLSLRFLAPTPPIIPENEPVEVELVSEVAKQNSAPDPAPVPPAPKAAPAPAPSVEAPPPPPAPKPMPIPLPKPVEPPKPKPLPTPSPTPKPSPAPKPAPAPKPVAQPKPVPKPIAKPTPKQAPRPLPAKPVAKPIAKPAVKPVTNTNNVDGRGRRRPDQSGRTQTAQNTAKPTGNLNNLLNGPSSRPSPSASPKPQAAAAAPPAIDVAAVKRALGAEISRQLKPRWKSPTGADVDQLVTILSWDLNQDGSLSGAPRLISQSGVTPSNSAQAALHRDNAIKAVRAAAPFKLPPEHYAMWKSVISFRFDKRLSQ